MKEMWIGIQLIIPEKEGFSLEKRIEDIKEQIDFDALIIWL